MKQRKRKHQQDWLTANQAIQKIALRLDNPHWQHRASVMLRQVLHGQKDGRVGDLRVHRNWPKEGAITFTRIGDGQRFHLRLVDKRHWWWLDDNDIAKRDGRWKDQFEATAV